jgi:hypothetical protein
LKKLILFLLFLNYNNELTLLNNLPANIKELDCGSNKITSLDNLLSGLKELGCSNNQFIYDFIPTIKNIRKYNSSKMLQ